MISHIELYFQGMYDTFHINTIHRLTCYVCATHSQRHTVATKTQTNSHTDENKYTYMNGHACTHTHRQKKKKEKKRTHLVSVLEQGDADVRKQD